MIKKDTIIGIVGAGAMGTGIALVAATSGHKVIVFDVNSAALSKSKAQMSKTLKSLAEKGKLSAHASEEISHRVSFVDYVKSFDRCGLVIEAVIENLDVKQTIFEEVEKIAPKNCVLATNTSSISISSIASNCERPENLVGLHFFNPAVVMPLVEIIPSIDTKPEIIQSLTELMTSWGKIPVVAKDTPGFIVNKVVRPFYGEALRIYEEGIADFATIDWAMKHYGGFRMGPFELMDFIGNDVNFKVTQTVYADTFYDARYKPSITQQRLVESGRYGRKEGVGFYDYQEGANQPLPVTDEELGQYIFNRILCMLINEAAEMVHYKTASYQDIDIAVRKGVNYPKGLLQWADEIGIDKVYNTIKDLREEYNEDRYRPSVLLKRMAERNQKFYNEG